MIQKISKNNAYVQIDPGRCFHTMIDILMYAFVREIIAKIMLAQKISRVSKYLTPPTSYILHKLYKIIACSPEAFLELVPRMIVRPDGMIYGHCMTLNK